MIKDKDKLFMLREEHVLFLKKVMLRLAKELYDKYGIEYREILRDTSDYYKKEDKEDCYNINYMIQRCEQVLNKYEKDRKELQDNLL